MCGSMHHPKPVLLPKKSVSEEAAQALKKKEAAKEGALSDVEKEKGVREQLRLDVLDCLENNFARTVVWSSMEKDPMSDPENESAH